MSWEDQAANEEELIIEDESLTREEKRDMLRELHGDIRDAFEPPPRW